MMMKNRIRLFLTCFAILNTQCSLAYNSNNRLVDTYDTLTIFDETQKQVGEWKLTTFPYIDGVSDWKFSTIIVVDVESHLTRHAVSVSEHYLLQRDVSPALQPNTWRHCRPLRQYHMGKIHFAQLTIRCLDYDKQVRRLEIERNHYGPQL